MGQCNCKPYQYCDGTTCKHCPLHAHSDGGTDTDCECDDGYSSLDDDFWDLGDDDVWVCYSCECSSDQYCDSFTCHDCPPNAHSDGGKDTECYCDDGYIQVDDWFGATSCVPGQPTPFPTLQCNCKPYQYCDGTTCKHCPPHAHSGGGRDTECYCDDGYIQVDDWFGDDDYDYDYDYYQDDDDWFGVTSCVPDQPTPFPTLPWPTHEPSYKPTYLPTGIPTPYPTINMAMYDIQQTDFNSAINYMLLYWCIGTILSRVIVVSSHTQWCYILRPIPRVFFLIWLVILAFAVPKYFDLGDLTPFYLLTGGCIGYINMLLYGDVSRLQSTIPQPSNPTIYHFCHRNWQLFSGDNFPYLNVHGNSSLSFFGAGLVIFQLNVQYPPLFTPACSLNWSLIVLYFFSIGCLTSAPLIELFTQMVDKLSTQMGVATWRHRDIFCLYSTAVVLVFLYSAFCMYTITAICSLIAGCVSTGIITTLHDYYWVSQYPGRYELLTVMNCLNCGILVCLYNSLGFISTAAGILWPAFYYVLTSVLVTMIYRNNTCKFQRSNYCKLLLLMLCLPPYFSLDSFAPLVLAMVVAIIACSVTFSWIDQIYRNMLVDSEEKFTAVVLMESTLALVYYLLYTHFIASDVIVVVPTFCPVESFPIKTFVSMIWIVCKVFLVFFAMLHILTWIPESPFDTSERGPYEEVGDVSAPPFKEIELEQNCEVHDLNMAANGDEREPIHTQAIVMMPPIPIAIGTVLHSCDV